MKVVDPQSALLTNAEVYQFLKSNKPRPADKKIGAYEPVKLDEYKRVCADVQKYITESSPLMATFPKPDTYMNEVVQRLRKFNLTKTEVLSIINLGIGLPRPAGPGAEEGMEVDGEEEEAAETNGDTNDDAVASISMPVEGEEQTAEVEAEEDPSARYLLSLVVEGLDERFPAAESEEKIQGILAVLRECVLSKEGDARNGEGPGGMMR